MLFLKNIDVLVVTSVYIYRIKILENKVKTRYIYWVYFVSKKMINFLTSIKKQGIYSFFLEMWNQ